MDDGGASCLISLDLPKSSLRNKGRLSSSDHALRFRFCVLCEREIFAALIEHRYSVDNEG
jgi:hypothetical protein